MGDGLLISLNLNLMGNFPELRIQAFYQIDEIFDHPVTFYGICGTWQAKDFLKFSRIPSSSVLKL